MSLAKHSCKLIFLASLCLLIILDSPYSFSQAVRQLEEAAGRKIYLQCGRCYKWYRPGGHTLANCNVPTSTHTGSRFYRSSGSSSSAPSGGSTTEASYADYYEAGKALGEALKSLAKAPRIAEYDRSAIKGKVEYVPNPEYSKALEQLKEMSNSITHNDLLRDAPRSFTVKYPNMEEDTPRLLRDPRENAKEVHGSLFADQLAVVKGADNHIENTRSFLKNKFFGKTAEVVEEFIVARLGVTGRVLLNIPKMTDEIILPAITDAAKGRLSKEQAETLPRRAVAVLFNTGSMSSEVAARATEHGSIFGAAISVGEEKITEKVREGINELTVLGAEKIGSLRGKQLDVIYKNAEKAVQWTELVKGGVVEAWTEIHAQRK